MIRWGLFVLFLIIGFSIYANSFIVPFFWDDNDNVVNNVYITSWRYLPKYFSENLIAGAGLLSNYWRPLLLMSYSLDYHFFGLNKYWWHFVNILLHVLNAFLLFLIMAFLTKKRWFAFAISLIFLAHPVQTEAITMITARADPLFFFFSLLGIFLYLKKYYWQSVLIFGLSLLVKETAIILPALLVLIEMYLSREEESFKARFRRIFLKLLPFFLLAGFYFLGRLTILNFKNTLNFYDDGSLYAQNISMRFFSFLKALFVYYGLLIFPRNLRMERLFEPIAAINYSSAFILLISLAVIAFSFWQYGRNRLYFLGTGWFFIALAPVSNILVPINRGLYEHWLYVPLIGFFIFLIAFLEDAGKLIFRHCRYIIAVILAAYLVFLGITTIKRNRDWKDPITFFNNILQYNEKSLLVWNNIGMAYAENNEFEKAKYAYEKAIDLDEKKQSAPPHHNLGNLYKSMAMFEEAVVEYEKAISIDKKFFFSYNALLDSYIKTKNQEEYDRTIKRIKEI